MQTVNAETNFHLKAITRFTDSTVRFLEDRTWHGISAYDDQHCGQQTHFNVPREPTEEGQRGKQKYEQSKDSQDNRPLDLDIDGGGISSEEDQKRAKGNVKLDQSVFA
jgi:hypothetical protein